MSAWPMEAAVVPVSSILPAHHLARDGPALAALMG